MDFCDFEEGDVDLRICYSVGMGMLAEVRVGRITLGAYPRGL